MASQTAWFGIRIRAGLESAERNDLVPGPDSDGEGEGAVAQDGLGAVVGPLQGQDDAAAVHPDEVGAEEVPGRLLWQLLAEVVLAGQRKNRSIEDFDYFEI